MKKFNFFWTLLLVLGVVSVTTSCNDDDDAPVNYATLQLTDFDGLASSDDLLALTSKLYWKITDSDATSSSDFTDLVTAITSYAAGDVTLEFTNLTTLPDEALKDCTNNLVTVIATKVTVVGDSVFDGCDELTTVTFSQSVAMTSVNANAFSGATTASIALTINVDETVINIGSTGGNYITINSGSEIEFLSVNGDDGSN